MKYRSRTEIVSHILEAATGGASKTRIMYVAYLSYTQLKEYFSILTQSGLLEYVQSEQKYRTTAKGTEFMQASNKMSEMAGSMTL